MVAFYKTPRCGAAMLHELAVQVWVQALFQQVAQLVQAVVKAELMMGQDPARLSG